MTEIPCTIYTAPMKLYRLETSLFGGTEGKYGFHRDQKKTKNNKKDTSVWILKKNEEGISVVKRIKTSVYGDYESDFAGEWQIIEWEAQVSPI